MTQSREQVNGLGEFDEIVRGLDPGYDALVGLGSSALGGEEGLKPFGAAHMVESAFAGESEDQLTPFTTSPDDDHPHRDE